MHIPLPLAAESVRRLAFEITLLFTINICGFVFGMVRVVLWKVNPKLFQRKCSTAAIRLEDLFLRPVIMPAQRNDLIIRSVGRVQINEIRVLPLFM